MSAAEVIRLGGICVRFLMEGKDSGGTVAMFEFDVAAGARVPAAHSHDGFDETCYMLGAGCRLRWGARLHQRAKCTS
jgi:uncharacterized RmlC-like cupin family protein